MFAMSDGGCMVVDIKRTISRALFLVELAIFSWIYFFGLHGFYNLIELRSDSDRIEKKLVCKKADIAMLKEQIIAWNVHSFYKEKMAREQLQMARNGELIYYIK